MGFLARCAILALPALAVSLAAGGRPPAEPQQEPRYDGASMVDVDMVVVEVREVAKGNPLAGVHLMARPETSRSEAEPMDIYVGPVAFLKMMEFTFHPHDRLEVKGSKVKMGTVPMILASEVRRGDSTVYIRDRNGEPVWKALLKD
jgi:hypothetical protein